VRKIILLVWAILPLCFVSAQESDFGNWLIYIGNKKIDSKLNFHHEIQYRNYNSIGDLEQLLIRTGIGFNLTESNNNLLLGYGFIASENYDDTGVKTSVNEHRIFQQFITKQNSGRFFWGHRYRFEQRFIAQNYKMRLRYFLNLRVPLNTSVIKPGTFYLSGYNEIFMDVVKETAFDRNRLYGGFGYQITKGVKVETGYMNQFLDSSNRDQFNVFLFAKF
tara:strand:+ start:3822 stop:4481 length:660 start_codon:yes stop_codon:yes gene_type:complete